jgi:hypothetical protein
MKAIVWVALAASCVGWADEATEQIAVEHTILRLNARQSRAAQFTRDADGVEELDAALRGPAVVPHTDEPMAASWPFIPPGMLPIRCARVRFLTRDVALADATVRGRPVLFVMKKDAGAWLVASVRFLR